jgi:1-acyl-sn-glycerol-3-phosphate acyltransferase
MFRNRRDRADALGVPTISSTNGSYLLAACRSAVFNVTLFISLPLLLLISMPILLRKQPPFYVAKFSCSYALWLTKIICGLEYRVLGQENVPPGACVFASKHQSAWDTLIYQALYPDVAYVLKQELTKIPVFGQYIKKYGMIAIDRSKGRQALSDLRSQAQNIVLQGRKIVIFPQGSRMTPGVKEPYQKGILALYKDLSCPVIPVALNSGLYWGRRSWVKWPGVVTLQFLSPMPNGLESDAFMAQLEDCIESASNNLL